MNRVQQRRDVRVLRSIEDVELQTVEPGLVHLLLPTGPAHNLDGVHRLGVLKDRKLRSAAPGRESRGLPILIAADESEQLVAAERQVILSWLQRSRNAGMGIA